MVVVSARSRSFTGTRMSSSKLAAAVALSGLLLLGSRASPSPVDITETCNEIASAISSASAVFFPGE